LFVLFSITVFGIGLYSLSSGDSGIGSIVLMVSGVVSGFLAVKLSSLKEQLEWERKRNHRLLKGSTTKSKKTKSSKEDSGQNAPQTKLPEQAKAPKPEIAPAAIENLSSQPQARSKPRVPKPLAPEPPEYLEPESPEFLYPEAPDVADYGPEYPVLKEPDPAVVTPVQSTSVPKHPPVIITRTSTNAGGYTQETWKGERTWSPLEVDELLNLYSEGDLLESIAIKLRVDMKDVVYKLTRLNFEDSGDLEDISEAPNDGKAWSEDHSKKLIEMNIAGISLSGMAKILGRTKLAIGWRLADQRKLNRLG
jgi:hypothetical protein